MPLKRHRHCFGRSIVVATLAMEDFGGDPKIMAIKGMEWLRGRLLVWHQKTQIVCTV